MSCVPNLLEGMLLMMMMPNPTLRCVCTCVRVHVHAYVCEAEDVNTVLRSVNPMHNLCLE